MTSEKRFVRTNPISDLCEVEMRGVYVSKSKSDLHSSVRFDRTEVEYDGASYRVSLSKAFLFLELNGFEAVMGTRFGDEEIPPLDVNEEYSSKSYSGWGVKAGVDSAKQKLSGSGAAKGGKTKGMSTTATRTSRTLPVRSLPGNRWEVSDPSSEFQFGSIVGTAIANARLIQVEEQPNSNQLEIVARLVGRKSDVQVERKSGNQMVRKIFERKNKDRIIGILFAKAMFREASRNGLGNDSTTAVFGEARWGDT